MNFTDLSAYTRDLIEEMNRYYDQRAPWHDEYMSYRSHEQMEELFRPVTALISPLVENRRVLEIACGTGNWTSVLAARADLVLATDQSERSLAMAREKTRHLGNVSLERRDGYGRVSGGESFDTVFGADFWSHIPVEVIPLFLERCVGALGNDGTAVFIDMHNQECFESEEASADRFGNRVSVRDLPDGSRFRVVKNFPDEMELRRYLEPYFGTVSYHSFEDLKRWLVIARR